MDKTREEHLRFAEHRIAAIVEGDPARRAVADEATLLLEQIVEDGQPTPQPVMVDGGIEIAWLVGDWYVGLIVCQGEGWLLWADQPDGSEVFEAQGQPGARISLDIVLWTQRILRSMGERATVPIIV